MCRVADLIRGPHTGNAGEAWGASVRVRAGKTREQLNISRQVFLVSLNIWERFLPVAMLHVEGIGVEGETGESPVSVGTSHKAINGPLT